MRTSYSLFFILMMISVSCIADRLPNETPENQVFTIDTVLDVTGTVDDTTSMDWIIGSPWSLPDVGSVYYMQAIALTQYSDAVLTNGGKLAENKNFGFDSRNKATGLYNIETEKVLTYGSTEGSHLVGEETLLIDNAGDSKPANDTIRCVFSVTDDWLSPFCDAVKAQSSLININSAQVSTKGQTRSVAKTDDIPAEINYRIAVSPDSNSGSGYAEGTVKTTFGGAIMEGRGYGWYLEPIGANTYRYFAHPSAENSWKDSSEVSGGIKNFQKALEYQSGFRL